MNEQRERSVYEAEGSGSTRRLRVLIPMRARTHIRFVPLKWDTRVPRSLWLALLDGLFAGSMERDLGVLPDEWGKDADGMALDALPVGIELVAAARPHALQSPAEDCQPSPPTRSLIRAQAGRGCRNRVCPQCEHIALHHEGAVAQELGWSWDQAWPTGGFVQTRSWR